MTQMKFIGLDVHKETVAVAIADAARDGEVRFYGTIPNTPSAMLLVPESHDHEPPVATSFEPSFRLLLRQVPQIATPSS